MSSSLTYTIVDTGQTSSYDNSAVISAPSQGSAFYGQDAQYQGVQASYKDNGDGTVTDLNTGLMWQQVPVDNITYNGAVVGAEASTLAGYDDWRLPTIKELYSLIDYSGYTGRSASESKPYIDTDYFQFEYGDTSAGERFIDAQYWSSTEYVSTTMNGDGTTFGVNFADGRIKGYPNGEQGAPDKESVALYVRGSDQYGKNDFVDNGNGTITDSATGLMWQSVDSGAAMTWEQALAWAENLEYGGYDDWRLPNAKELQSIVDYSRSPDTTQSAAIDPLFSTTSITSNGETDYGFYWTGTTHVEGGSGDHAVYISFGEAEGWMGQGDQYQLMDVHGAGAQRSDPKEGDAADYPYGFGPQGDVIRIENFVRAVRDVDTSSDTDSPVIVQPELPDSGQGEEPTNNSDDSWEAGAGDERFDGGDGFDRVKFSEGRDKYQITVSGEEVIVEGAEGRDTLTGIERVHFGNQGMAFDGNGVAGQAYRMYKAAFDRAPDDAGLGYWIDNMDKGMSLADAGRSFVNSSEFQSKYGALDDRGFIDAMYQNVLDRQADDAGYAYWLDEMERGVTDRAGVLASFSESAENQGNVAGQIANGIQFDLWLG